MKAEVQRHREETKAEARRRREEMKALLRDLDRQFPGVKQKVFGAIQRYPLYGWSTEELQR